MNKKISVLKKSEANLLRYSTYLSNNVRKEILDAVLFNKKIAKNQLNEKLELEILSKKDEWLAISSNEWQLRRKNPIVRNTSTDKRKWKRCSLCNTLNRIEFYVENKYNKNVINIGGTCSSKVITGEINELAKLIKTPLAGKRYTKMRETIPNLHNILLNPNNYLSMSEFVVSSILEKEYIDTSKNVYKSFKLYLNSSNSLLSEKAFLKDLEKLDSVKAKIADFQNEALKDEWSLSKEMQKSFQSQPDVLKIISRIKINNGKLNKQIAKSIVSETFLHKYIKTAFNEKIATERLKITNCLNNKIHFQYMNSDSKRYHFSVNSDYFISNFGNLIFAGINLIDTDIVDFFVKGADIITPIDNNTRLLLSNAVFKTISNNPSFFTFNISKLISKKWKEKELGIFEVLTSDWIIYESKAEEELYLFKHQKVFHVYGVRMLFQTTNIQKKSVLHLMKEADRVTKDNLLAEIKSNIELAMIKR